MSYLEISGRTIFGNVELISVFLMHILCKISVHLNSKLTVICTTGQMFRISNINVLSLLKFFGHSECVYLILSTLKQLFSM